MTNHQNEAHGSPVPDTADSLADLLRSAAGWLRLAADELESGSIDKARDFATLGEFGAERVSDRIAALRGVLTP